ncbi:MAG TPA: nuclear transport factor 2 family protein [Anaeromyxobacteraceae bacterium]|nr:nuclear transport factor 2 family protein [Anaeromyxobacteraceae bacterium]
MGKRTILSGMVVACLALLAAPAPARSSDKEVAAEIIASVKAQWAAGNMKNTPEAMKNVADDYTEFNGDFSTRLDGKAINVRLSEAADKDPGKTLVSEMANEKVQVYGSTAILTYNYVGMTQDKDGKTTPSRAKSTRVYAKINGKWMLVHANFAPDPLPKQ